MLSPLAAPLIERVITLGDIVRASSDQTPALTSKLIAKVLAHLSTEYCPKVARDLWSADSLKWSDIVQGDDAAVEAFLNKHQLQYITNPKEPVPLAPAELRPSAEKVQNRIKQLLEEGVSSDVIFDYVSVCKLSKVFFKTH